MTNGGWFTNDLAAILNFLGLSICGLGQVMISSYNGHIIFGFV